MEICQRSPYDGFSLLEPACCGGWGPREKIHHRGWCYGFPGLYGGFSFLEPLCSGRGLQEKRATVGKELSTIASSLCPHFHIAHSVEWQRGLSSGRSCCWLGWGSWWGSCLAKQCLLLMPTAHLFACLVGGSGRGEEGLPFETCALGNFLNWQLDRGGGTKERLKDNEKQQYCMWSSCTCTVLAHEMVCHWLQVFWAELIQSPL